jgi:hypothetical protein
MAVRSQLIVVCDDVLPGCSGRVELVTADLPRATSVARRKAADAGRSTERTADGRLLDVCPRCSGALLSADAAPRGAPDRLLALSRIPPTIGEAAQRAREREALRQRAEPAARPPPAAAEPPAPD